MALSFTSTESEDAEEEPSGARLPRLPKLPSLSSTPVLVGVLAVTALLVAAAGWYIVTGETPAALIKRLTTSPSFSMALPPPPGATPQKATAAGGQQMGQETQASGTMMRPPPKAVEPVPPAPPPVAAKGAMPVAPAETPPAKPPAPAAGAMPPGPSPVKPIPLQKAAEMPPPPPAAAPASAPAATAAAIGAAQPMSQAVAMAPSEPASASAPASAAAAPAASSTALSAAAPTSAPAAPQKQAMVAPPPPPMNEPLAPPGGEPLAPPSFAQLPARTDLKPLAAAPVADLLKDSPDGPLPVASGGKEPRSAYARPFVPAKGAEKQPKIAIVVVGLGISREATEAAIAKLPPEIDLSFSPNAGNLDAWIKKARAAGHEVLLDLPLEPPNFPLHDAGPLAILVRDGPNAAVDHLHQTLGKATSYVGVAAALGSPVASTEQWAAVLRDLKGRGLLLVGDPIPGSATEAPAAAAVALVPDHMPFRAAIDAELGNLLAIAQRDGAAVAYVSPIPVTFERLLAWAVTLPQKGAVLAPASAVVQAQP